jgi:hypothetical protein
MLSASSENADPWHEAIFNPPNISLIQSISDFFVKEEVLLQQHHVFIDLVTIVCLFPPTFRKAAVPNMLKNDLLHNFFQLLECRF